MQYRAGSGSFSHFEFNWQVRDDSDRRVKLLGFSATGIQVLPFVACKVLGIGRRCRFVHVVGRACRHFQKLVLCRVQDQTDFVRHGRAVPERADEPRN
jgi:hypothetical protein